jgi:hypothetical protein
VRDTTNLQPIRNPQLTNVSKWCMDKPIVPTEQSIREHTARLVEIANNLNLGFAEAGPDAQFQRTMEFSDLVQQGLKSLDHLYRASVLGSGPSKDHPWPKPTAATPHLEPLLAVKRYVVPVSFREITDEEGPAGADGPTFSP